MTQALLQVLRWIAQRFPKLVDLAVRQWSARPAFVAHPASCLDGATLPLTQGAARTALARAVGTEGNLTAWRDAVDLLLADVGKGDLDATCLERLRHACDGLYEEGMTTSWQYLAKGRLRGLERRLWLRSVEGAEAMLGLPGGAQLSRGWVAELGASGSGPIPASAATCRAQWFRWLAERPRPLLSRRAVADGSEFQISIEPHRLALRSLLPAEKRSRFRWGLFYGVLLLGLVLALAVSWLLGSRRGGLQAQHEVLVEGLPRLEHQLRDPVIAAKVIRNLIGYPGTGSSRLLYEPEDTLAILLASSGDLSLAARLAQDAKADLERKRRGDKPVNTALTRVFEATPPGSRDSEPPAIASVSESASTIAQLACLESRVIMSLPALCSASDDEVFGQFVGCQVSDSVYKSLRSWEEAEISSRLRFTELKLALRRLGCSQPRMPPATVRELALEKLLVPGDECGAPGNYGLETLSRAGEIASLVPRDAATLAGLGVTGQSFVQGLIRWSGQVLVEVLGKEREPPDACLERLAEEPTGQWAAAVMSWLAAIEPGEELAKGAQRAARRVLEAPIDWRIPTRDQAAGRSPMVFLAAARLLQVGTEAAWPGLMRESRCGFHCLAAIATVSCDQARARQGSEYRPESLSLAALIDPRCADAWAQGSPAPRGPGGVQANKEE